MQAYQEGNHTFTRIFELKAGARPRSATPPIVPTAMQDMIDAVDPGPDIDDSASVNLRSFGFDDEEDEEMAPPSQPVDPRPATPKQESIKQEIKEEPRAAGVPGFMTGVRRPEPVPLPDTAMTNDAPASLPGAPVSNDDDDSQTEEKGRDDQQEDGEGGLNALQRKMPKQEVEEAVDGLTTGDAPKLRAVLCRLSRFPKLASQWRGGEVPAGRSVENLYSNMPTIRVTSVALRCGAHRPLKSKRLSLNMRKGQPVRNEPSISGLLQRVWLGSSILRPPRTMSERA